MKKLLFSFTVKSILSLPSAGIAGWFGPSTFEECILKNMKDIKNNIAAAQITMACRKKFPEKAAPPKKIETNFHCYDQFGKIIVDVSLPGNKNRNDILNWFKNHGDELNKSASKDSNNPKNYKEICKDEPYKKLKMHPGYWSKGSIYGHYTLPVQNTGTKDACVSFLLSQSGNSGSFYKPKIEYGLAQKNIKFVGCNQISAGKTESLEIDKRGLPNSEFRYKVKGVSKSCKKIKREIVRCDN